MPLSAPDSLTSTSRAPLRNGIGTQQLNERPSGDEKQAFSKAVMWPRLWQKKSPKGAWTAGVCAPSQYISIFRPRSAAPSRFQSVAQIRRIVPLPSTSASVNVSPAAMPVHGAPLRPNRAVPPPPLMPCGFSNVYHRVCTGVQGIRQSIDSVLIMELPIPPDPSAADPVA